MVTSQIALIRPHSLRALVRRAGVISAAVLFASGLLVPRLAGIGQGLWTDEIQSLQNYIGGGPSAIFGRYETNDHMLLSFLGWLTVKVPGGADWLYRLWGIVPFLLAVGLVAWWLRRKAGPLTAALFVAFATVNTLLLQLTSAARGYGLAFLMMAVLLIAGCEILAGKRAGKWWVISFFAAATLGAWTLPTFVLPAAAVTVVLLIRRFQWRLVLGTATSAALIVGWYAPGAAGLLDSSGQQFGSPLGWWSPLTGPFELLPTSMFFPGDPFGTLVSLVPALLLAPLLILGIREARLLIPGFAGMAAVALFWPFVFVTAARFFVVPRFFSYLLVPTIVLAALGARRILCGGSGLQSVLARQYLGVVFACAACVFAAVAWNVASIPREDIRGATGAIKHADPAGEIPVLANVHFLSVYTYYLPPTIRLQRVYGFGQLCRPHPRGLIFVYQPFLVPTPNTSCLVRQGAVLHRFLQWSRGGRIDVWVLPPD